MKNAVLAGCGVLLLCVLGDGLFTVNQIEQAVVTRWGEPVRVIKNPGLNMKIPFLEEVALRRVETAGGSGWHCDALQLDGLQ